MFTKIVIPALLLACLVSGCGSDRPDDLIPPEKMALVLRDIHKAEQRVSQLSLHAQDSSLVVFHALEERIYKKYEIDTAAYRRSYVYYVAHPELYQKVYSIVVDSLEAEEKRVQKLSDPKHPN